MAMQLRSGRRLASPVPAPGGDLRRRVRPRRSQDEGGDGDGKDDKDLISSLPKDMRLEVLARLQCTREAMRTSVLSEPWRRLWTELRDLTFDDVADLDSLLGALAQVQPRLHRLCIKIPRNENNRMSLGGARVSALLRAAARLEPLQFVVRLCGGSNGTTKHRGAQCFVLPCFARATSIELWLCGPRLRFRLPPPAAGSFASLEQLTIFGAASFVDPGALLPRCPRLRKLMMDGSCPRGVGALAVESSSLEVLVWYMLDVEQEQPVDVHVTAPNLRVFVFSSFSRKFAMSLSAPKMLDLYLECFLIEDSSVGFVKNVRWRLYELRLEMGPADVGTEWSDGDGRQHVLSLYIDNAMVTPPVERSFEQEVPRLPGTLTHFSALELHLRTEGHVFGALVMHLLRIRTDIRRLKVVLLRADAECWEHCDCDFASNWRDELISLPRLEVAEFVDFLGHDHEMDFLKLLFGCAPSLKTMTVEHFNEVSIVRGACQKLRNMFSANASVKFSFS